LIDICRLGHLWNGLNLDLFYFQCHNPSLGLVTKARAWKGVGQKCNLRITFTFLKVWENVRDWAHTLIGWLPFWEFESLWSLKSSKNNLRRKNSLYWTFTCTTRNLLRLKCLKWACMIHLSTYNTSYGRKKGWLNKHVWFVGL
jgi:hypothetical protein